MIQEKKYLTVDDIKNETHLSNDSIRKYIREGLIKASKVGVRYLVKREDLDAFIESRTKQING